MLPHFCSPRRVSPLCPVLTLSFGSGKTSSFPAISMPPINGISFPLRRRHFHHWYFPVNSTPKTFMVCFPLSNPYSTMHFGSTSSLAPFSCNSSPVSHLLLGRR